MIIHIGETIIFPVPYPVIPFLLIPLIFGLLFYGRFLLVWCFLSTLFVPLLVYSIVVVLNPQIFESTYGAVYVIIPLFLLCVLPLLAVLISAVGRYVRAIRDVQELMARNSKHVCIAVMCALQLIVSALQLIVFAQIALINRHHLQSWHFFGAYIAALLAVVLLISWLLKRASALPSNELYTQQNTLTKWHIAFILLLIAAIGFLFLVYVAQFSGIQGTTAGG